MQDKYISLQPDNAAYEEKVIKKQLAEQRCLEAAGGQAGPIFGTQLGLAASTLMYSAMHKEFSIFPLCGSKLPKYGYLFGGFAAGFVLGMSYVKKLFGNNASMTYLTLNKRSIVRGDKPWEQDTKE